MNGLDLFSGIGGITLALEPWVRPIAYCENDRHAQSVLMSRIADGRLPRAPIWDDVTSLNGSMLPPVDIIYGGFPCQDISVAGRGAGLDGERSGLFFEIIRLAKETRAPFVFLENVPAIRTRGLREVIRAFTDLGYDCRWTRVSAKEVGAPHLRERWFMLAAHSERIKCWDKLRGSGGQSGQDPTEPRDDGEKEYVADAKESRLEGRREGLLGSDGWWAIEPSICRVVNGVPLRVDRLRGLGNAVVPAQAREAFMRLLGIGDTQ